MACNLELQIFNVLPKCTFKLLKQLHGLLITSSLIQNTQLFSKFLRRTTEFGQMGYPTLLFSQMCNHQSSEVMIWNAMIRGYAFNGPKEKCILVFDEMRQLGLKPHNFTYPYVLNCCSELQWYWKGTTVHCQIIKSGFLSIDQVGTSLFNMYKKFSSFSDECKVSDVRKVFDDMCTRPVEAWNRLMSEYVRAGCITSARNLFELMPSRDVVSWNTMISGYIEAGNVATARELFELIPEKNVVSWTSMIKAYADDGDIDNARRIFEEMPCRNVVSWNSMIASYARHGKNAEALDLFARMQSESVVPDGHTFVSLLSACANSGALEFGKYAHGLIDNWKSMEIMVGTALVDMYAKCGDVERAFAVFAKVKKDTFCWNVMIRSLAIHGRPHDAIKLFFLMQKKGWKPNDFTFQSALFACSHGGLVEEGCKIFHSIEADHKTRPKIEHYGCLVDLLCRNGQLEEALLVVEKMPYKLDAAIGGALLGGCKGTSDLKLAEGIMERVREMGTKESGIYALMSNLHASEGQWPEARVNRKKMEMLRLQKRAGISSIV